MARFPPSTFPTGRYKLHIRAEQFVVPVMAKQLNKCGFEREIMLIQNGSTSEMLGKWDCQLRLNLFLQDGPYIPVCDMGEDLTFFSGNSTYNMTQRPQLKFDVSYGKVESSLESLELCKLSDLVDNFLPGSYFNTTACTGLSSVCCENTVDGWGLMYRESKCCHPTKSTGGGLLKLKKKHHKILFAGDSTTEQLMHHLQKAYPLAGGELQDFVKYVRISYPFRNSLRWITEDINPAGHSFWSSVTQSTIIVIHSCGHDVSVVRGKNSRMQPYAEYHRRLNVLASMLKERAHDKSIFWVSCGSQSFQNFPANAAYWSCEKSMSGHHSNETCDHFLSGTQVFCQRSLPDAENSGWFLDFMAYEAAKKYGWNYIDVHTFGDVAKGDLGLFPHIKRPALQLQGIRHSLTGDIHLSEGRGHRDYPGWLYTLKSHIIMNRIVAVMHK
jgi:hypothetical protein